MFVWGKLDWIKTAVRKMLREGTEGFPRGSTFVATSGHLACTSVGHAYGELTQCLRNRNVQQNSQVTIVSHGGRRFFCTFFTYVGVNTVPVPVGIHLAPGRLKTVFRGTDTTKILCRSRLARAIATLGRGLGFCISVRSTIRTSIRLSSNGLSIPVSSQSIYRVLFASKAANAPGKIIFGRRHVLSVTTTISIGFDLSRYSSVLALVPLSRSTPLGAFFVDKFCYNTSRMVKSFAPGKFLG